MLLPPFILSWVAYGFISFFWTAALYPQLAWSDWPAITGLYTAAWVIGFLTLIVPNGWGVREGLLTGFLVNLLHLKPAVALGAVLPVAARLHLRRGGLGRHRLENQAARAAPECRRRMRILHLIYDDIGNPWLGGGGAVRTLEINRRLAARGHQVIVLCGAYPGAPPSDPRDGVLYLRVGTRAVGAAAGLPEQPPALRLARGRLAESFGL